MFIKCFTHIMVAMATYFPQKKFFVNFFSNQLAIFLKIIFKVRKKKISGIFKKCYTHIIMVAMVTYFFPNFFVKYEHFSNQAHFF